MCDPITAGLILTAVSGGAEAVNTNQALRRQDKQAAEGIRRQGVIQSGASARIGEQIEDVVQSTGESERKQSLDGFLNALRNSSDATEGALDPVLAANPRFAERVSGGKSELRTLGAEQAGRLSRIDAPIFQRQAEAGRLGRTAVDINEFGRQSTMEDFLTRLRIASEQPNPLVSVLSKVGKGVGSALTLRVPGKGLDIGALLSAGTIVDNVPVNPFFKTLA